MLVFLSNVPATIQLLFLEKYSTSAKKNKKTYLDSFRKQ